jgi:hypothetical protein
VLAASSKFPLSEEPFEGAVVGSVIETNIEGIDREFKVTSSESFSFYNKRGICLHILYENHSFKLQSLSRIMN